MEAAPIHTVTGNRQTLPGRGSPRSSSTGFSFNQGLVADPKRGPQDPCHGLYGPMGPMGAELLPNVFRALEEISHTVI